MSKQIIKYTKAILLVILTAPFLICGAHNDFDSLLGKYSSHSQNSISTLTLSYNNKIPFVEFSVANATGCTGEISGELRIVASNKFLFEKIGEPRQSKWRGYTFNNEEENKSDNEDEEYQPKNALDV